MTTVFSVRRLEPARLGKEVAQVTDTRAADAVARLMGETFLVEPVRLPRPKPVRCFLCDPFPWDETFRLFPFSSSDLLAPKYFLAGINADQNGVI